MFHFIKNSLQYDNISYRVFFENIDLIQDYIGVQHQVVWFSK